MTSSAERHIETMDTIEAIEECYRLGWTDGLPVVPPADYMDTHSDREFPGHGYSVTGGLIVTGRL